MKTYHTPISPMYIYSTVYFTTRARYLFVICSFDILRKHIDQNLIASDYKFKFHFGCRQSFRNVVQPNSYVANVAKII